MRWRSNPKKHGRAIQDTLTIMARIQGRPTAAGDILKQGEGQEGGS
jgi:hypothetical protein